MKEVDDGIAEGEKKDFGGRTVKCEANWEKGERTKARQKYKI